MRIIFFGTSIFAVPSLKVLAASRHKMVLVVTQPDRKKGRHLRLTPPAIKEVASGLNIPVFQPIAISSVESVERLKQLNADLFVIVSFGQLLSKSVLDIPKKFSVNLHASLLPRYRGAAPINWAIINGEKKTGVSVFRLEEKMDTGDIILEKEIDIEGNDNAVTLGEKLSQIGAGVLTEAVDLIDNKKAVFKKQDEGLVSFAPKLKKGDGLIDWGLPAIMLHNRVRGLLPWPGAFTNFKNKTLKILETRVVYGKDNGGAVGRVIGIEPQLGVLVKTIEGCLAIQRLHIEGSRPMGFEEFLRGHRLEAGDALGAI